MTASMWVVGVENLEWSDEVEAFLVFWHLQIFCPTNSQTSKFLTFLESSNFASKLDPWWLWINSMA